MNGLEESFTTLLGQQPTDKEKQNLYRARDALHLKNNDAVWLLLMALGHYETLYGQFPGLIREAASGTMAEAKAVAEAQMRAAAEITKRDLSEAVARTADEVARHTAARGMLRWAAGCIATAAIAIALVGYLAYRHGAAGGHSRGWGEGYRSAADEKAAASWANTPDGELAYDLAKAGSIRILATCAGRGWERKDGACYPQAERGAVHGWKLPVQDKRGR